MKGHDRLGVVSKIAPEPRSSLVKFNGGIYRRNILPVSKPASSLQYPDSLSDFASAPRRTIAVDNQLPIDPDRVVLLAIMPPGFPLKPPAPHAVLSPVKPAVLSPVRPSAGPPTSVPTTPMLSPVKGGNEGLYRTCAGHTCKPNPKYKDFV